MASVNGQQVQGGHLVKIVVGGKEVGWGRTSQLVQNFGTEGVYVLGDIAPVEHIPLRWDGQITLDQYFIHAQALGQAVQVFDFVPVGPAETLEAGILDFNILGKNEELVASYLSCTIVNHSINVAANQLSGQNATFQALNVVRGGTYVFQGLSGGQLSAEGALV